MKNVKRIFSLICVIAICFTLICAPSAHASGLLGGQAAGAWIAAGLVALNIVAHTGAQAIGSYFGWQAAPTSQSILEYAFPNATSVISDYMNASTIEVKKGVVTIDGVQYDELLLGPEWSSALKTNLFDFKTKWQILSGQAGTLAEGVGFIDGCPVYRLGQNPQNLRTPIYQLGIGGNKCGNISVYVPTGYSARTITYSNGTSVSSAKYYSDQARSVYWYTAHNDLSTGNIICSLAGYAPSSLCIDSPFKYDYASGIVPADPEDIPDDYSISVKIPHDKLETFYNTYPQYNVDNSVINIQQDQIDIDELTQAIFDQIQSMDEIKAEWTNGEEPEPPVPVDPIENIDQNVEDITGYQQDMQQQVDHMHQDVEAIHQTQQQQQQVQQQMQQTQQQMQQTQQDIAETSESIDNTLQDIKESLEPGDITEKTFDLRELFPFCIPFDIYHLLQKFDGTPTAPHVQLPIVIPSIGFSYTLDLDFSAWDPVAAAMRTVELIVYALGLAWATSKVIKW